MQYEQQCDIAVVGAGAAGLFAAIFVGSAAVEKTADQPRVLAFDGTKKLGTKILIAGGGRCNVTHDVVRPEDYAGDASRGASRSAIKKVLRSFTVEQTIEFFRGRGVELKREDTGKLFPTTDRARTVLNALLEAAYEADAKLLTDHRVTAIRRSKNNNENGSENNGGSAGNTAPHKSRSHRAEDDGKGSSHANAGRFILTTSQGEFSAGRVILSTGGRALPSSGSDGFGYQLARSFGHTVTKTWPALVPLLLPANHWLKPLKGIALDVQLTLAEPSGKVIHRQAGAMLLTHFGLSGPAAMDLSRHFRSRFPPQSTPKKTTKKTPPGSPLESSGEAFGVISGGGGGNAGSPALSANLLPAHTPATLEADILQQTQTHPRRTVLQLVQSHFPERLAVALLQHGAKLDGATWLSQLTKDRRRNLVRTLTALPLPVVADRGYEYAEVTAGGVPLSEINLSTMESRVCPGLYLAGEILDVDGRIGGYNFQWAWCTGRLAGLAAAKAVKAVSHQP